jgi:two-component sensor histidine kinase
VELRWSARRILFSVRDNGAGLPSELPDNHRSSGIALVRAMSRQLGGELTIGNDPAGGTCATISFPTKRSHQPRDFAENPTPIHHGKDPYFDRRRRSADSLCA